MKAAPFGYHRARSVSDAVDLLTAYDGTARVLAGGQSLVPMMNMRLIRPDAVVDIGGITELGVIRTDGDRTVVGATVRYSTLERSPEVAVRLPLAATMVRAIGDRHVRNRGTIGGSLAQGDPTGEMPLACMTLGAVVRVSGPDRVREVPVAELYEGSYATCLDPCEVLTEIVFPATPQHHAFAEMTRRHNDFAVISVAAVASGNAVSGFRDVRIGLGGVNDTPVLATEASTGLAGTAMSDAEIADAAHAALAAVDPPTDIRASAEYRRHLVPIYVRRVLEQLRAASAASPQGDPS
ncbi:MAG TPA: xanthine dehydrogenase family protein subunit M [Mycobacteriales bacterium]|nr:xanthine dehydrogenase family protein subunit M [Mycobacteriales bacterium]